MVPYQFNLKKYINLLENEKDILISPNMMVYLILKSYNIDSYNSYYMIQSLLNSKKKYPELEDYFEFAAEYLFYKYLKRIGVKINSEKMRNLLDRMKNLWDKIFSEEKYLLS